MQFLRQRKQNSFDEEEYFSAIRTTKVDIIKAFTVVDLISTRTKKRKRKNDTKKWNRSKCSAGDDERKYIELKN